jgi:hypothetical protein
MAFSAVGLGLVAANRRALRRGRRSSFLRRVVSWQTVSVPLLLVRHAHAGSRTVFARCLSEVSDRPELSLASWASGPLGG